MIKGLRPKETFEDATRAYRHQDLVTFPNRVAVQALASVEMSRVVQQDLEEMSRNAHLEHERQGQLLALGRAGVPHHVATHAPSPADAPPQWGVRKGLRALVGGVASMFASGDDDAPTTYAAAPSSSGAGASSSGAPIAPSVDHNAPLRDNIAQLTAAMGQLQEREAARQDREAIEQEALANAMDVDETPKAVQQNVQNILNLFQHNFTLNDQRQMHFTSNDFVTFLTQNFNQVNAQFNAGVDPRLIMHQAMQDAQRGDVQGLAMDVDGQLHITPPGPARAQVLGAKPKAKARGKRPTGWPRAIMGPPPVSAALAVAAAPSGPGTLIPWQKQNAVIATPSSASAAASSTTRTASGGATLVRPTKLKHLGKTSLAHAKARAKAEQTRKAATRLADPADE